MRVPTLIFWRWVAVVLSLVVVASADPPPIMNHQGRIAVAGTNYEGTGFFKFALVDGAASETFWSSDGTGVGAGVPEPVAATAVVVNGGHYAVVLGEAPMPALPVNVFSVEDDLRLRVWFGEAAEGPFELLSPDRRLTSTGYAFSSKAIATLEAGYETGRGSELVLQEVGGGEALTFAGSYTESFVEVPAVVLGEGWTPGVETLTGFTASAAFASQVVDGAGSVGRYASLAVIGGRPAIAYRDDSNGNLKFAQSLDAAGAGWSASLVVRVAGAGIDDVGAYASLAVVAGRPAIGYYDSRLGDLKFIRATNERGTIWPANAVTVDSAGNVGRDISLAVVGGVPAMSYTRPSTGEVVYAWAADVEGGSWPAANVVAIEGSGASFRRHTSLTEVGGKPAIAVYNVTGGDLRYLYLSGTNAANLADWTGVDVATNGDVGTEPSLAVVEGRPAIGYGVAGGGLNYVRANDAAGASWGSGVSVSATGAQGSLAVIGGRPGMSFYDTAAGDLVFAWASDAVGTSWPTGNQVVVDGAGSNVGTHSSLAVVDGLPGIAYHDESNFDLRFAALPVADWQASTGEAEPILVSGVKAGGVLKSMLADEVGVWGRGGDDLVFAEGRVGIGRVAVSNALEVEGTASKTTAGGWLSNSDGRIKTKVRGIEGALEKLSAVRLVEFEYTEAYRAAHPSIEAKRYPNVIAQEFAEVFPEWVTSSGERLPDGSDSILQVDTYPLTIYAAAGVKELAERNRVLEESNAELRGQVEALLKGMAVQEERLRVLERKAAGE